MAEAETQPRLIYAGIDEAGYGPRLGPLCVGLSVLEIRGWEAGERAPDLWARLKGVVCRDVKQAKSGRLAVNDSKKLKLHAKGGVKGQGKHPLTHLERGVVSFLGAAGEELPDTDEALFAALGVKAAGGLEWYGGAAAELPLSTTADHLRLMRSQIAAGLDAAGVGVLKVRCRAVDERTFNSRVERTGSKAAVSFGVVAAMLKRLWEVYAGAPDHAAGGPRVVVDRQGGRTRYGALLRRAVPGAMVRELEETPAQSRYELTSAAGDAPRRMTVIFRVEAESAHFPVALASMTAKLVRELMMLRFNRYWCERIAELKPTAGYATDARRWLNDAAPFLSEAERGALVRLA